MASLKYYLDKPRKDSGLCAVYLRYKCVQGNTTFYSGHAVPPAKWDAKAQRLKGTSLEVQKKNQELASFRLDIEQHVTNLRQESGVTADPRPADLKRRVAGEAAPSLSTPASNAPAAPTTARTLPELVELVLHLRHGELRKGSRQQYTNALNALLSYCPREDARWRLDKLTAPHLDGWRQWMVRSKALGGLDTDNQTANNRLALIAAVLNYARTHYKHYRQQLDEELLLVCGRKFKVLKQVRQHLSEEEFLSFYSAPLPASAGGPEYVVRDAYCLSWLTSLRQSDVFALGVEHIVWSADGTMPVELNITSIKSSQHATLPLNELAACIILRWLNRDRPELAAGQRLQRELARFSWPGDKVFPQLSRGRHNIIKRLFKRLELFQERIEVVRLKGSEQVREVVPRWELLTLHTARHGFGNLMAQKNVPIDDAMLLMGHADMSSTKIYYHRPKEQAVSRARAALASVTSSAPATTADASTL